MAIESPKKGRGARARAEAKSRARGDDKPKDDLEPQVETSQADPIDQWADKEDSPAYTRAKKLYTTVRAAFENKQEQYDALNEYWHIYHAAPDDNLKYAGNTQGYIPAVRDSVNARCKRALKQLFPFNDKHVEAVSTDSRDPRTVKALLEHYIRKTRLRATVRTNLISGDVTGQWNLMVDWLTDKRMVTKLVARNPVLEGGDEGIERLPGMESHDDVLTDPTETEETTEDEEITESGPDIVDFATEDLAVIPATCNDLQKAEAVAVRLRLSKSKFEDMVDTGVFIEPKDGIDKFFKTSSERSRPNSPDRPKKNASEAGVKTKGTDKYCEVWMVYTRLNFEDDDKQKRSGIIYYAGEEVILSIIKNPLWSGKIPVLSESVDQMTGSFFGKSKIEPVKFLQWNLCDFWNMGQDSAMYSLLPIWAADPMKVPQWQQLVMGLAAVWPANPADIKPMTQPQLYKEAAQCCDVIKRQIWESMDVNEQMMGRMPQGRKNNAMIGAAQQNQDMNISDHASRYEDVMLNPLLEMLFEFDQQFRTTSLAVQQMGELGYKAAIEDVPVTQWGEHYFFRWSGTEFMASVQRQQQQIAWLNVLKGIPPQMMGGLSLDLSPVLVAGTENLFGPEMAARILVDNRNQFTVPADVENEMMHNGFEARVHEGDNDVEHLQSHMKAAGMNADPVGLYKMHMQKHYEQLQKKREIQMSQQMPKPGLPGTPGGMAPGAAGTPKPGAVPAPGGPRGAQNPPGAIQHDNMVDPTAMGRG